MNLLEKNQLQLYEIAIDDSVDLAIRYECCRRLKKHEQYNPHLGDINEFLENNKRLAYQIANKYKSKSHYAVEIEDLIQEAYIGLFKTYSYYDPSKGALATLAYSLMRTEIVKFIKTKPQLVRPPGHIFELAGRIVRMDLKDSQPEVIAKVMEVTLETAENALWYIKYGKHTSTNQPMSKTDGTMVEYAALIGFCDDDSGAEVEEFLNAIPDRVRKTILYLMAGYERKDIAAEFGVSRMWVGKLIEKAQELYVKHRRRSTYAS